MNLQEDNLISGVTNDQETVIKTMHTDEIHRNRNRIGEIIAFLEKSVAEIEWAEENAY